ncbi:MAG: DUF5060 domain-containing protein [Chloroflexota bacterium]|nr:DUF5060 domain-containing protein [Chloroflexota bacterium]
MSGKQACQDVEQWDILETTLDGPEDGNPFTDVTVAAQFTHKHRVVHVDGFYDGEGVYRVRFMPDTVGEWRYTTRSNHPALDGISGEFVCTPPSPDNHGPVSVADTYHFAYADGTPYYPVGTTCYVWNHQGKELEEQTLDTLQETPFNKLRMCVFPKHYRYNRNEPVYHPFQRAGSGEWDFARFNPAFFQHLEQRVQNLRDLGIEADIILFHPYDRWGYAHLAPEIDERYLRYVVARLAAYRNVWWSMANEYDLMEDKSMRDWDRFFRIVQESDPYQHLRSVHNCRTFYDHSKPWVTHLSVQSSDLEKTDTWRAQYKKPVVVDECKYEGNIPNRWGNMPPQEMVRKCWEGTVRGGYVGHGETYLHPEDILWWSKGGTLHGQSPPRIAFLKEILEAGPACGLDPVQGIVDTGFPCASKGKEYYLTYCGVLQPAAIPFSMPEEHTYKADVIDTWEMRMTEVEGTFSGEFSIDLPGKPYMAVRLRKES